MEIRQFRNGDSIEEITLLLNRAYAILADQGLRFVASWQTPDVTASLIETGTCFLAIDGGEIVGTALLYESEEDPDCPYYSHPGVRYFGKFAVSPERQGQGIGRMLFDAIERFARETGASELACDTADSATRLIEMYKRWGMEIVGTHDWEITNYVSVILAKKLTKGAAAII